MFTARYGLDFQICTKLSTWDLWWTKRHYDRVFSPYFSFHCQYHSTNAPYSIIHLPPTLYNVFLPALQFPLSVSFHQCSILTHSSIRRSYQKDKRAKPGNLLIAKLFCKCDSIAEKSTFISSSSWRFRHLSSKYTQVTLHFPWPPVLHTCQ